MLYHYLSKQEHCTVEQNFRQLGYEYLVDFGCSHPVNEANNLLQHWQVDILNTQLSRVLLHYESNRVWRRLEQGGNAASTLHTIQHALDQIINPAVHKNSEQTNKNLRGRWQSLRQKYNNHKEIKSVISKEKSCTSKIITKTNLLKVFICVFS